MGELPYRKWIGFVLVGIAIEPLSFVWAQPVPGQGVGVGELPYRERIGFVSVGIAIEPVVICLGPTSSRSGGGGRGTPV